VGGGPFCGEAHLRGERVKDIQKMSEGGTEKASKREKKKKNVRRKKGGSVPAG